jgi:hypothetical protein
MTNITACELDYYSPILLFLDPSRAVFPPLPPDHWPRRLAGHLKFHLTVYLHVKLEETEMFTETFCDNFL